METLSARLASRFELLGTQSAEMAVTARSIVEGIDVLRHVGDRELPVLIDLFLDSLFLQAAEEGLDDGIVPSSCLSGSYSARGDSTGRNVAIASLPNWVPRSE